MAPWGPGRPWGEDEMGWVSTLGVSLTPMPYLPITHLSTRVTLLSWGARLSLGALQEIEKALEGPQKAAHWPAPSLGIESLPILGAPLPLGSIKTDGNQAPGEKVSVYVSRSL